MQNIKERLNSGFVLLDGAMGTMLQKKGLELGERPELLCINYPEMITAIHRAYVKSGAQIIYANTFGASEHKLAGTGCGCERVIAAAITAAKTACQGSECAVALDMGPLGELLEPYGSMSFEAAYNDFAAQAAQGERSGAELIIIETMTDLLEAKAALLAATENTSLPVMVSMSFEQNGRTFTGCSPAAMAITLSGLGACAIGVNCSLGPRELAPIIREISEHTALPIIVKANAGLPDPATGAYSILPEEFAAEVSDCVAAGATIIGGCCGTTPDYTAALSRMLAGAEFVKREHAPRPAVCTPTRVVELDRVRVIGERINPTGKKLLQQALTEKNMGYILAQGITQVEAGADILDVNVGMPGVNESELLPLVVKSLQAVTDAPLQLDSSDAAALEAALRVYSGKAIVNSVNGESASLSRVLPLVKKYGAAVVGLTLDENGIPKTAQERYAIARRIVLAAEELGIPREDVYIDCLTLTVSAQQEAAAETLSAVRQVSERLCVKTVLGVSNISFGLPKRELINNSFLCLALAHGLSLPIINPNVRSMLDSISAFNVLTGSDKNSAEFIERFAESKTPLQSGQPPETDILAAISRGLCEESRAIAAELLKTNDELWVVNERLIPALDAVGRRFESGEIFLPQLLQAATAAQGAFEEVKLSIMKAGKPEQSRGTIVLATVKGDIHDIGKNIVKIILENYGYKIIDLGRDVPKEAVVETVLANKIRLVGLSALMSTTLRAMEETIAAIKKCCADCRVFVGGAVLTPEYAMKIGADFYAKDAKRSVDIAKEVFLN